MDLQRDRQMWDFSAFGIPLMKLLKKIKNRKKKQTSDADKKETLDDSGAWKDEGGTFRYLYRNNRQSFSGIF